MKTQLWLGALLWVLMGIGVVAALGVTPVFPKSETTMTSQECHEDEAIWWTDVDTKGCVHTETITCDMMYHYLGVVRPYTQQDPLTRDQAQFITQFENHYDCTWED